MRPQQRHRPSGRRRGAGLDRSHRSNCACEDNGDRGRRDVERGVKLGGGWGGQFRRFERCRFADCGRGLRRPLARPPSRLAALRSPRGLVRRRRALILRRRLALRQANIPLCCPSATLPRRRGWMPSALEEKDAIRGVLAEYCFRLDDGRFAEMAALFTENGTWDTAFGRVNGRATSAELARGIRAQAGEQRPRGIHLVTNISIALDDASAQARSNWTVVQNSPEGPKIGSGAAHACQMSKE